VLVAAALAGALAPGAAASAAIPGDHPDPSLLRAADGWYVASTSGGWLPGFPILHTRDLEHWRQVGSVLSSRPSWVAGDLWAPDLVRRGGRVLAYYAALARDGRRCVAVASAPRLRGPYRDNGPLLCSHVGEIDPVPVRDEHGADWLVWKRDGNSRGEPTPILAAPLAPGGMSLAAPPRELFRADAPWERGLVEAPELLRRGGVFYLVYSAGRCCGRQCTYATGVARSLALLGPWEKRPDPVLTGNRALRCPGHASAAPGPGGAPLLAYHAYGRGDPANRRLIVAPLGFDAGWPEPEPVVAAAARPAAERFEFAHRLDMAWEWPIGPRPAARISGGRLRLGRGALARRADSSRFSAWADVAAIRPGSRPGVAAMASAADGVGVELRGRRAVAWRVDDESAQDVGAVALGRRTAGLRLRVSVAARVRLAVGRRGHWRRVGEPQPLPRWRGGPRVALTVGGGRRALGEFGQLWIDPR
jgi:GH43 family beta-xylosidase